MRVLIDARSLAERNTSNHTYWAELVSALGRRSDVELLLASNAPIAKRDVPPNGEAIFMPSSGRWFSLVKLPTIARSSNVDLTHVQYSVSPLFRTPVVTTVHDVSFFIEPNWFGSKDRFLLQRSVPASCRRAARVLAVSETCRKEILQYISVEPEKVVTTLEGTPTRLAPYAQSMSHTEAQERTLRLTGGRPFALLVGGASPRKNLAGAIQAVELARERWPDLALLVTGRLPIVPPQSWVFAPGPLEEPDLAAVYLSACALLHPSYHEGFGLTILEAMSLGCPVIASDRGAIPEVAGDAAILCDPDDVAQMADALVGFSSRMLREPYERDGLRRAQAFTWDATAEATVAAYRAAL